jgi:hypothetical protein
MKGRRFEGPGRPVSSLGDLLNAEETPTVEPTAVPDVEAEFPAVPEKAHDAPAAVHLRG